MLVDLFSNVGHSGGSGLGLFIAAGIVKLHEGCSLTASSPGEGRGSTFFLHFPVAPPPVDQALAVSAPVEASAAVDGVAVGKLNVLIAVRTARSGDSLLEPSRL